MADPVEQLQRSLSMYKGLVEVSSLISAISDFDELLSAILDVAWKVMRAEASSLFLLDDKGDLRLAIGRGADGGIVTPDLVVPKGRGIAGWVLEKNEPLLVEDAYADARFFREADQRSGFKTRSILCVPLCRDNRTIGVLQVLNPVDRERFDATDLDVFYAYGHLAATAIDKLRAMEREAEQNRVQQELSFAREIQRSFLPQALPDVAGIDFAAAYRPALNISGDFYDVIESGPDEIFFVIGDVAGKGVPAALLMAQALSYLRLILQPGIDLGDALAKWNETVCARTIRGMFITVILGRIVPSRRHVEFANAGHHAPLRLSATGIEEVPMAGAPPVGILPDIRSTTNPVDLVPGEWLVFFTDGLVESFDRADNILGKEGLKALLAGTFPTAADVVAALTRGEAEYRAGADPYDDLTVLVFGFR